MPVTQFDLKYVEDAGLVKFDFLGLKTLSVLHKATRMLAERGVVIDLATLAWDDEATYRLLQSGCTVGVFQVESEGMRRTLAAVKPTVFEDIIALGALYRPGPMDNIPMFGRRKNGQEAIEYPHPLLENILAETYGIFVYQEQVMQAAQVLAGYTLGQADLLRRAMGKKIKAEMDAQRAGFVKGCADVNGIGGAQANALFDLIDKFAGYGFNKSHAAAYALLTYQTAWLKAHHPAVFFAASMCFDVGTTDKLCILADDMRKMGVACLPPCANASSAGFAVQESGGVPVVRYALGALKGVGERAMELLVEERRKGRFASIDDFAGRIDPRLLNRRQIESLAAAGAFDAFGDRAALFASAETILSEATRISSDAEKGQGGLFGGTAAGGAHVALPANTHWSIAERMAAEKEAFGFYFSAHPTDRYRHLAAAHKARSFAECCAMPASAEPDRDERGRPAPRPAIAMAALVEEARWRTSARGRRYLLATLSDASGQYMASCFDDEVSAQVEAAARTGGCGLIAAELDRRPGEETPRVTIRSIRPLEQLAGSTMLRLELDIEDAAAVRPVAELLKGAGTGRCEVRLLALLDDGGRAEVRLPERYLLDAELAACIERVPGVAAVRLEAAAQLALVG